MLFVSSKRLLNANLEQVKEINDLQGRNLGLERMNQRLQSDLDWMKHRLTQVERERAQLMQSVLGVKVSAPEFVPTYRPDEALNEDSSPFKDTGEDSTDPNDQFAREHGLPSAGVPSYNGMPKFKV